MASDILLSAIALGVGLGLYAASSLGETSLASIRRDRLQILVSQRVSSAASLERLHSLPTGPVEVLSLIKLLSFSASLLSAVALVVSIEGVRWVLVAPVALAALIFLGVIHSAARRLAGTYGERIAIKIAAIVRVLAWLLGPILMVQAYLNRKALGADADYDDSGLAVLPGEINLSIDSNGEPLEEHEVRMIRGVVQLDKTTAREIMVPRVDMVAAEMGSTIADLAEQMMKGGHSRIPVYLEDLDQIEGIAYARDVLSQLADNPDASRIAVEKVVRPALFIPESKTLEELLKELQQRRVHMAIVVDEYGGVSGLVTIEDLLEEIVGEIQDEFDVGDPEVERVGDNQFVMDARVSIDQLQELMSVSVEGNGFDTLGGFVYQRLGKIPSPGDAVEYDGLRIEVISTIGRRLKKLRLTKLKDGDLESS